MNVSQGGPNDTGSNIGVTGPQAATCWTAGTTSTWSAPDGPISDPYAQVCAPGQTSECETTINGNSAPSVPSNSEPSKGVGTVSGGTDGCPTGTTCDHYVPGLYSSGIEVKNATAVFDPGLYYVTGGMSLAANSQVCPGSGVGAYVGDGSGGTTFYFADANSISVSANSGGNGACTNSSGTSLTAASIECTGSSTLPGNLPGSTVLSGNILLAPCSGYYGDPLGTSDPTGEQRGILFFQDRSDSASPSWAGGGAFTLAGSMYFHYCDSSVAGSGEDCNFTSGFTTQLELGGNSGSTSYILGDIVTDELEMHGTPDIDMDLSPTAAYYILKASLLQ